MNRYTNYLFQGEAIIFQNFDAMQHGRLERLKPNQNIMLWTRTRHLKLTYLLSAALLVSLFLPWLIKINCLWHSTELKPSTELFGFRVPFQGRWKYVNIHKSAVTYVQDNSLNILRLTFLKIYFVLSWRSPNIGKRRVKIVQKTNYFFYFTSPCTNRFVVFYGFFLLKCILTRPKQNRARVFFFSNIFWIICFWLFSFKIWFQNLSKHCLKNWRTRC